MRAHPGATSTSGAPVRLNVAAFVPRAQNIHRDFVAPGRCRGPGPDETVEAHRRTQAQDPTLNLSQLLLTTAERQPVRAALRLACLGTRVISSCRTGRPKGAAGKVPKSGLAGQPGTDPDGGPMRYYVP